MPELTPEEKQKIYEEEKARIEARGQLAAEKKEGSSNKIGAGCLVIIIAVAAIVIISQISTKKPSPSASAPKSLELNATVQRSLTQVVVKNEDAFDWKNIKIELNAGMLNSGYFYKIDFIKAGNTVSIGLLNFAKSNGERLNPYAIKVQKVYIFADTPSGAASYAAGWK